MTVKLKTFFPYFGAKWLSALKYPIPKYSSIIEPFAGAAGYSIRYYDRNIKLIEANEKIAGIWQFLITAKESEISSLSLLNPGQSVDTLSCCEEAKWLIGMWLNPGSSEPKKTMGKWKESEGDVVNKFRFWGEAVRDRLAWQVNFIRHWQIAYGKYQDHIDTSQEATWFVDPPYQHMGKHYKHGTDGLDFSELANTCRTLPGQVIVCENYGADWLPFRHLAHVKAKQSNSGRTTSHEVIWTNECYT